MHLPWFGCAVSRVSSLTPSSGVPADVDQELSVPVLVPDPAMSRHRTPTTPPRMTIDEFVREAVHQRQRIEREQAADRVKLGEVGGRVGELQTACGRLDERVKNVEANLGEFESIAEFRETFTMRVTRLDGGGANGEVGNIKARLAAAESRKVATLMFLAGLIVTAGSAVAWAATNVADLRARVQNIETNQHNREPTP